MKSSIQLIQGDCLDELLTIPKESIDLILADPPYGVTQCKWDTVIDLELLWKSLKQILKPNGVVIFTAIQPFTSILVQSNLEMFKCDWVWQKPKGTGHLNAKKQPMRNKEDIVVFYKNQPTYNPQMTKGEPFKARPGISKQNGEDCYGKFKDVRNDNSGFRYPKQIQIFSIIERNKVHPTQKPIALLEYFIKTYSNVGDTVLDFAMGSGSTGIACQNLKRNFIGIEINKEYFEIAKQRVKKL